MDFSTFFQETKQNRLKAISGVLSILGVLISGAWAADSRWNQSDDINRLQSQMSASQLLLRRDMLETQKMDFEDKIFALNTKISEGKATSLDKALLKRYTLRLEHIERQLDSLKSYIK